MLNFQKLIEQIESIDRESFVDVDEVQETLENAREALALASSSADAFAAKLDRNSQVVLWPVARPLEPVGTKRSAGDQPDGYSVVAVDGSQIMPSHHEVHTCYLLNVGIAVITYGAKFPPVLESLPLLYSRPEDLYPLVDRRRLHIDELYVSLERTILEIEKLSIWALEAAKRGLPVLALYDGSLVPWSVEKLPDGYQKRYMERMSAALQALRQAGIPLIGYLSRSRAADLVNCLRVWICPFESSDCRKHCSNLNEEEFPCSRVWPLADRQLLGAHLQRGESSGVTLSAAGASRLLPSDQRICFNYINVGEEIARLEFPRWVFTDELLDSALRMVLSQSAKGMGYPISLAEAHHLAIIKGAERDQFFDLIARQLVDLGIGRVKTSPKESKKRMGFV